MHAVRRRSWSDAREFRRLASAGSAAARISTAGCAIGGGRSRRDSRRTIESYCLVRAESAGSIVRYGHGAEEAVACRGTSARRGHVENRVRHGAGDRRLAPATRATSSPQRSSSSCSGRCRRRGGLRGGVRRWGEQGTQQDGDSWQVCHCAAAIAVGPVGWLRPRRARRLRGTGVVEAGADRRRRGR